MATKPVLSVANMLSPKSIFFYLEGYTARMSELSYFSSDPLFSWQASNFKNSLKWGASSKNKLAFWVTELAMFKDNEIVHEFPGAYINAFPNTRSAKTINYIWRRIHSKYTFKPHEIYPQCEVREYLQAIITSDITVYYKGGYLEAAVAELCGSKNAINIELRGVKKITDKKELDEIPCKVHATGSVHCCAAEVSYYMRTVDQWADKEDVEETVL